MYWWPSWNGVEYCLVFWAETSPGCCSPGGMRAYAKRQQDPDLLSSQPANRACSSQSCAHWTATYQNIKYFRNLGFPANPWTSQCENYISLNFYEKNCGIFWVKKFGKMLRFYTIWLLTTSISREKLRKFSVEKIWENATVLRYLAVDNLDFTRKIGWKNSWNSYFCWAKNQFFDVNNRKIASKNIFGEKIRESLFTFQLNRQKFSSI